MLFLLTGNVQIGKTRWLERLVEQLADEGVPVAGVTAPGVWRERLPGKDDKDGGRFEKLGIDNVLLPQGQRISFARRCDLARAEGVYDEGSQSARAQLAWAISDEAIAQVNRHFDCLAREVAPDLLHAKHALAQADASCEACGNPAPGATAFGAGLLVVDELGQLELVRGGGLVRAAALLDAGSTKRFPHALVVVRERLLDRAVDRFAAPWGGCRALAPDDEGRLAVRAAFGLV